MSGKNKHYSDMERKYFLEILKKYCHRIENKKSDLGALKNKEDAWQRITADYNNSSIVASTRDVAQLKKLWTNIKQQQRNALTKEKQSRFATGGEPATPAAIIDPDVAIIAPNLMKTAPVLFSSNVLDDIQDERRNLIFDGENIVADIEIEDTEAGSVISNNIEDDTGLSSIECVPSTSQVLDNTNDYRLETSISSKKSSKSLPKRREISEVNDDEMSLKLLRLRKIIEEEQKTAEMKRQHEEEMHSVILEFTKKKLELELKAAKAKTELSELLLRREKQSHN